MCIPFLFHWSLIHSSTCNIWWISWFHDLYPILVLTDLWYVHSLDFLSLTLSQTSSQICGCRRVHGNPSHRPQEIALGPLLRGYEAHHCPLMIPLIFGGEGGGCWHWGGTLRFLWCIKCICCSIKCFWTCVLFQMPWVVGRSILGLENADRNISHCQCNSCTAICIM